MRLLDKTAFLIGATILTAFVFQTMASFYIVRKHYVSSLEQVLLSTAKAVQTYVKDDLEESRFSQLDRKVKNLGRDLNKRITIILPKGKVVADSEGNPASMVNHRNRPEIRIALKEGRPGVAVRLSDTVKKPQLYAAVPILGDDGRIIGACRISIDLSALDAFLWSILKAMLMSALLILLVVLIIIAYASKKFGRSIQDIHRFTDDIAAGNLGHRLQPTGAEDIDAIMLSLNDMSDRLKGLFQQVEERNEELTALVSSIGDAIAVISRDGWIKLANDKMVDIFGEYKGRYYWQAFRDKKLVDFIKQALDGADMGEVSVTISDRDYLCAIRPIPQREDYILTIRDITISVRMDALKKAFVANASHELKTPLTAVRGYLETIEEIADGSSKAYIEICLKNINRLESLVNDLLLLSELECPSIKLLLEWFDISQAIEKVITIFQDKAKGKGIVIEHISESFKIMADQFMIEQVLINLIDNAVKYTDKGFVRVEALREQDSFIIKVIDTGIGMPKDALSRIFERFYVVDKARSRQSGGTGLGLSIVKHIVELHNGHIEVESALGEGSTFTIKLPISQEAKGTRDG